MKTIVTGWANLSAQTYWISNHPLFKTPGRPFIWLAADEEEALSVWRHLNFWQKNLSPTESNFSRVHLLLPDVSDFPLALSELMGSKQAIYVVPHNYWRDLVLTVSILAKNILVLEVGQKITPQKVKELLVEIDYESGGEGEIGTFRQRGGNIIVHASNLTDPVRLEFDEEKLISIKNASDGSSFNKLEIFPAKIDPAELIKNHSAVLKKGNSTLPDFNVFIYQDPSVLAASHPEAQELFNSLTGEQVIFQSFGPGNQELGFKLAKNYHKNFATFLNDFKERQNRGWQIFIAVDEPAVVFNLLKSHQLTILPSTKVALSQPIVEGFISEEQKIWFVTGREIFGTEKKIKIRRKTRRVDWGFFSSLKPGDFLVHEDHGIARFGGLVKATLNNESNEFFLLEYSVGDKLYLPVDQAHKIDKYIGQPNPVIHRLSGTAWSEITAKVKEEARHLAEELVKVYAQRKVVEIEAWQHFPEENELAKEFPYQETPDQKKAIEDVLADLEKPTPMDRLVVGDVGFGKTEVAIRAAFRAVLNGKQVAVLAPTTILVQQHLDTFRQRLKEFSVNVEGLSRFTEKLEGSREVAKVLAGIRDGTADVVIGTSRLLSTDIKFKDLGLVIVDEEQRFGVKQKERLKVMRSQAHFLTLSATPIPRTLYFSISGLRDASTISTPPPGRKEIETSIAEYSDKLVGEAIMREINRGGQVYFLYNKVATITIAKKKLEKMLPAGLRLGIMHGQMPEEEIAQTMQKFDNGQIDILVCSSIIENGLDLPNVNTLIVEDSTRFGLGQLYQLRGRIGRGLVQAYAYFLYKPEGLKGLAARRLRALQEAQALGSGYQLAIRDLEMRGIGNLLGKEQHGYVAAVGLSTYLRLLDQASEEIETGIVRPPIEAKINLPVHFGISPELEPDSDKRVQMYRRFSLINSLDDLKSEKEKFSQQFSHVDEATANFFLMMELKLTAESAGIKSIDFVIGTESQNNFGRLVFDFRTLPTDKQVSILTSRGWKITVATAKSLAQSLKPGFLTDLIKFIANLV